MFTATAQPTIPTEAVLIEDFFWHIEFADGAQVPLERVHDLVRDLPRDEGRILAMALLRILPRGAYWDWTRDFLCFQLEERGL